MWNGDSTHIAVTTFFKKAVKPKRRSNRVQPENKIACPTAA
jgi:hypothetical protein